MPDRWSYSGRMMTSTAAAASAASSAATTQRFDRHVSHATCQLTEINEHLLCALCSGYLVDATTIIECLHTFCRSCIVRYLESSETCPVCDVPLHQTNPLLGIRADTTLQTLVYKLVPGVFKDEVKRRCTVINNAHADGKSSSIMDRLLKDICDMTTGGTIYTADEQFSVCLQYAPSLASSSSASSSDTRYGKPCSKSSCAVSQQDLAECSYLLCPASVTVAHLKKLIRNKLELSSDLPLDLYHSSPDGSLDDVYTLADVAYITAWTSVKPLHFYYQVNAKPSQTSVKKISSVSEETDCKRKVAHGSRAEKLPGGACLKRIISNNRQNVKVKGVICSSVHKKAPKAAAKKVKSQPDNCLAVQIPKGSSSRDSSLSAETSPISGETKKLEEKSDLKDNCRRKEDCDPQDGKAAKVSFEEQNRVKSLRDFDSKEISNIQTKTSERNLIELTESEVTDTEINPKTSSRTAENDTPKQHLSPNQKKSGLADCSPSADSALSPSRPETVSQSAMTVDGFDTTSDAEGNAIDSASSPPPSKRMKMAEPTDRNLFAAINSMIVNNNDNVVSSSTSSQASADDSSDNKTSVETQTTTKLISRSSKKGKLRTKKDSVIKSRSSKPSDPDARVLPPSSAGNVVALSADTSSQSISVTAHTYSTAVDSASTQQCTSATLCVPLCISDKTGGGSNLILNLPQNVSVQCRIRSDKILIASNPTTTTAATPDVASTTFSSISYNQTMISAKSPATSIAQSQTSPSLTSQASPTLTSEATLTVKSPTQPITALSGQPKGSSITRTTVTSLAAPSMTSSVVVPSAKSTQLSDNNRIASTKDNRIASPLHRQLDTRTITENKGNVCNNSVTSVGECQTSGKEVPVKRGTVKRTVNMSDATSLKFRNKDRCHDCLGEAPLQSANRGKSETVGSATPCVSPSPVRCTIPTRSPETVLNNASAQAKPQCESNVSVVAAKPTCLKSTLGQKEVIATKVPCYRSATDLDVNIRDKVPQNVATTLQQNPVTSNLCMTISRPKEVVQPASTTSVVVANSVTAATSSGVSTTKAVLFKPYQITTTASHTTSPKRSADGIITATATFPNNPHHTGLYTSPAFPIFPGFQYPKDQPTLSHQADVSKAYCCMMRDSVLASTASCEMAKTGMSAVHRTMSNIPLHSVIKVPTYTARKMPQNKKSEKKGSRSPRNEPSTTPVASVTTVKKPESCHGSQETLGHKAIKASEVEGKLVQPSVPDYLREIPVSKGSQSGDRNVTLLATPKGIKDDVSLGKVDEGWNQLRASSSIRSCLKLPLVNADIPDKGDSSSSCSISTSSNEQSVLPAYESETVPKTPLTKKRFDLAGPSGSDHRHSPKRPSGKSCPTDEMSYTCAEADSGTSPGAVSLSPPRCGSKDDAPPGGLSPNSQQSPASGTSLRKKLVIDLERCSPRLSKSSPSGANYTPSPSTSLLRCCSPTTTTIPPADAPLSGQTTPPRLVISLPRCQVPAPTTLLSPSGGCGLSQWSPTSSGTDNSPPTTKRLKLMCNGMTIYRTLESPGSRSPRRTSGGGGSRRSSPVSAPVVADCPLTLLSRASSCKSPSSSPQGKSRRKSNSSTPVPSAGVEPKSVAITSGEPVVVVSVDSTSTSPRSAATIASLPSDNGLFTVMTPWKGHESVEEPLELTTKEVKERQKEREYAKLMTNQRPPPSAFTT